VKTQNYIRFYLATVFLTLGLTYNQSFALNAQIPDGLKSNLSVNITDVDNIKPVYTYNNNTNRLIASNVKLFTTLFALDYLGSDFHWHTRLKYSGNINNNTLFGNLYIQGGGDPSLDNKAIFEIISSLKRLGVSNIKGNVIIDSSIFNTIPTYSMLQTAPYDVDKILPSGLIINGNKVNVTVQVTGKKITLSSNIDNLKLVSKLTLESNEASCSFDDTTTAIFNHNTLTLQGTISTSCNNTVVGYYLMSNFNYNKAVLSQAFNDLGIKISGKFQLTTTCPNAYLIYDYSSPSIEHILIDMNKFSNNLYAMTIISSVGAYKTINNSTFNDGAKIYYDFLKSNNLLNPAFKLENGAGLSRKEFFTTQEVANLLYIAHNSITASDFETTLPVAMQEGSLANKFKDFAGRFRAKTGTLNDTRALAGYFHSKNGHKYIIVIVANNLSNKNQKLLYAKFTYDILAQLDNI
jgi:D-alanyl-D-alanine carboxypeptidase/D-alanyl-D-alanine-endopeptidase (penicillin-binding protein 4)